MHSLLAYTHTHTHTRTHTHTHTGMGAEWVLRRHDYDWVLPEGQPENYHSPLSIPPVADRKGLFLLATRELRATADVRLWHLP